jgi:hypothetical protein
VLATLQDEDQDKQWIIVPCSVALHLIGRYLDARMRILRVLCVCPQTIDLKPGSVCLSKDGSNGIKEK